MCTPDLFTIIVPHFGQSFKISYYQFNWKKKLISKALSRAQQRKLFKWAGLVLSDLFDYQRLY